MDLLPGISSIVGMIIGGAIIIVMLILSLIKKAIDAKQVVLVVIGFILIGAPSAWNSISIKFKEMEIVIEQIKVLKEENSSLTTEVNKLESQRTDMSKQLSSLQELITATRIPESAKRSFSLQIDSIELIQQNMETTSSRLSDKIDFNRTLLKTLEDKVETLKQEE